MEELNVIYKDEPTYKFADHRLTTDNPIVVLCLNRAIKSKINDKTEKATCKTIYSKM